MCSVYSGQRQAQRPVTPVVCTQLRTPVIIDEDLNLIVEYLKQHQPDLAESETLTKEQRDFFQRNWWKRNTSWSKWTRSDVG